MNLNIDTPAALEDVLLSREERVQKQENLIKSFSKPIISLTVNIPGSVKLTQYSIKAFDEACRVICDKLGSCIVFEEKQYLKTGCQGYFVVDMAAFELKSLMCRIEDKHPLGRLFDADVIDTDMNHLSRKDMGVSERKCFICNDNVAVCARSRKHSVDELIRFFEITIADWEKTV